MNKYEVWREGLSMTGNECGAQRLGNGTWEGKNFQEACEKAMISLNWDMSYYNKERNSYYGCRFYDNELDARKSFG